MLKKTRQIATYFPLLFLCLPLLLPSRKLRAKLYEIIQWFTSFHSIQFNDIQNEFFLGSFICLDSPPCIVATHLLHWENVLKCNHVFFWIVCYFDTERFFSRNIDRMPVSYRYKGVGVVGESVRCNRGILTQTFSF